MYVHVGNKNATFSLGYLVMYAVQRGGSSGLTGSEEWTTVTVAGDRTRARIDRLRPRTTYHFKLQAKNSKGMGPVCAPITYTTAMGELQQLYEMVHRAKIQTPFTIKIMLTF